MNKGNTNRWLKCKYYGGCAVISFGWLAAANYDFQLVMTNDENG